MRASSLTTLLAASLFLVPLGCSDKEDEGVGEEGSETGDGDGDGDDDPATGDGDADPTAGDGDGDTDPTTGDGDGDTDPTTGDGDGDPDPTGDGDGDPAPIECGEDPGWGTVAIGEPAKHIQGKNHDGTTINTCEYLGRALAIDVSAVWCGPCQAASAYLSTGAGQDPFSGFGPALKSNIDAGVFVWVTALVEDVNGGPGTIADGTAWDMQFPNPNIPVLTEDEIPMLSQYLPGNCVPRAFVVDPEGNFFGLDDCASWNQLGELVNTFGE